MEIVGNFSDFKAFDFKVYFDGGFVIFIKGVFVEFEGIKDVLVLSLVYLVRRGFILFSLI